jgi:hypothetical protein
MKYMVQLRAFQEESLFKNFILIKKLIILHNNHIHYINNE